VTFGDTGDTVLNALVSKSAVDAGAYDNVYFIYTYTTNDSSGENSTQTATTSLAAATVVGDYYAFPCGRNSGIGRVHCKVKGNFVTVKNGNYTISGVWEYSIKDYVDQVANGGSSDADWAKALGNYGFWTALKLAGDVNYEAIFNAYGVSSDTSPYALASVGLPANKKAEVTNKTQDTWSVAGVTVTTGYKPKMKIRLNTTGLASTDLITIKVDDTVRTHTGNTVYYKEIAVSNLVESSYTLSDIPTKYLENDIVIGVKKGSTVSPKTVAYSYYRYAKARAGDFISGDAQVFQSLADWIHYIAARYNP
jgi:hypothetical protein